MAGSYLLRQIACRTLIPTTLSSVSNKLCLAAAAVKSPSVDGPTSLCDNHYTLRRSIHSHRHQGLSDPDSIPATNKRSSTDQLLAADFDSSREATTMDFPLSGQSRSQSHADAMISSPDLSDISTPPTSNCNTPYSRSTLSRYGLSEKSLVQIRDNLVTIALSAGQMMLNADPSVCESESKKNSSDRVTKTDKEIESMVFSRLQDAYPQIAFLGEETFKIGEQLNDRPTFVCDPIDGTLNFIHGFPNTAVSLALTIHKKPVIGVVYNPFRKDLFTAIKNQGAYLTTANGQTRHLPLRSIPAPLTSLNGSLVALEWGSERKGPNWDLRSSMSQTLLSSTESGGAMVHSIRSSGSAALDFCYVAAGQLDLFWEGGCWIWDVCAGWCILEEAGGLVASANPDDWEPDLEGRCYLAVRGAKRSEQVGVVKELWGLMKERKFKF